MSDAEDIRGVRRAVATVEICSLSVHFGGVVAVDDVSMEIRSSQITGLIGPNGAGKTTTINVGSGLLRSTKGAVKFNGRDVTRASPGTRARLGIGRTFQAMELFDSMLVGENVALGAEAALAGRNPFNHMVSRGRDTRRVRDASAEAMELCGVSQLAGIPVASLSTGQRRLVELARCLAGPYQILMLDEPSSGLDQRETAAFGRILERVVEERGVGILLVEHDMALVMGVCSFIYVLEFGRLVAGGTPNQIRESPVVQAAYLGEPLSGNNTIVAGVVSSG